MEIMQLIREKQIRFLDHSNVKHLFSIPNHPMTSFAIDDAIAIAAGEKMVAPTIRMWVHEPTLVLGIPDSRLPFIEQGIQFAKQRLQHVVVRNSGGLAVLLNQGVLNMSLIVPNDNQLSIHSGYDVMHHFIQDLFRDYTSKIRAYEIVGSYCPGDYDLSIDGVKFAGISQRRVRNGIAIQIYMDIEGKSNERASIVKDFYQISKQDQETTYEYPVVDPSTMGTISELVGIPFTVKEIIQKIKQKMEQSFYMTADALIPFEEQQFFTRLQQMQKRNEKLNLQQSF